MRLLPQQEPLTHARTPTTFCNLQPANKHFDVLWNVARPSRGGGGTGPNEPQTAAGRWGASASYNCPALLLLFSLSSSPSFLRSLRHLSHSSPVAKTTPCYLRRDQHEPEGFTFNCYRCDPSLLFFFSPTGMERLSLNEGRKQLLL